MKKTIKDHEYKGKKVLLRCDLNVPIESGLITDETRIRESLGTINYLIENDAKVIILAHMGKVKTEEDKQNNTLYPVYLKLKELLNTNVYFSNQTRGVELEEKVNELEDIAMKSIQIEAQTERCFSNNEQSHSALWDNIVTNIHSTGVQKHKKGISVKKYI